MIWLKALTWGLPRYVWIIAAVALMGALWVWLAAAEKEDDRLNQQVGAVTERAENTGVVLERVEQGNAVRNEVEREADRGAGAALYEQCVRAQRDPAAPVCQRFLPQ